MQSEDRPIHFSTELIYPPFQPKTPVLQKLYYDLSQTSTAAYDNVDFNMPGPPRFYSKRGAKAQSMVLFLPDRMTLIEEWVDTTLSRFLDKVREVGERALQAFEIGAFIAQTATIRTTFALTHFKDARVFILDHVCGMQGRFSPHFTRPIGIGGIRLVFPPTPDHSGEIHLIAESYRYSINEVFVEIKGVFGSQQIGPGSVSEAVANIRTVRSFITDNVYPFLQQYDSPPEEAL